MEKDVLPSPTLKKRENLKQRAYLNSLTSILDFAVTQVTGFIVSPFIVSSLGSSMYGVWQMLGQMTGYAKIADTRATQVLKWTVAKKKDVADEEELRSDVTSAFFITLFIIPLVLIAGGIVSWYAPLITKAEPQYYNLIRITCSLLMLSLVITKLFDLYESVLRGMNLSFKRMGLRAGIVAFGGGLKVLVLTLGYGLIGLSAVQVVITLVIGISYYLVVRKHISWFGFGRTSLSKIRSFSKVSGWYLADNGANLLLSNSDKILLGIVASPVVVTYYTLTQFLPFAFQGLINRVVMGIIPGVGKLLGLEEFAKVRKVTSTINSMTFLLTTASGVAIILLNQSFLKIWVGDGLFAGTTANLLIMVMIMQDTFIKHDAYIISATLDLKHKVLLTLFSGVIFILIGYFMADRFGIAGLCLSMIAGKLILHLGQQKILYQKLGYGSRAGTRIVKIRSLIVSLLLLAIAAYLSTILKPLSLVQMAGLAPLAFVAPLCIFYWIGMQKEERNELLELMSSIKFLKLNKEE
ncbi:lipopolysaccharide biosynthesis protein [Pontibacter flavimaris]|uniref:Polysaccharide biosynthesis protein n=1 Tax=Pontibacter flavimaris TaxID=1797110 RepID=A0A1Q5PBT0_9BACT|nr:oligosaccharide flippase family protein [Pontibacter flavimaris]OKL39651.1 polysaccharide biosynthesis protein [Pontibacter flavimaris]